MARELRVSMLQVTALALIAVVSFSSADYCKIKTCQQKSETHTMCLYPQSGPAQACLAKGDMGSGLTQKEKDSLIEKHNEIRRNVAAGNEKRGDPGPQPGAVEMPDLEWDDELAMIAQRWADQCIWDHDGCRDTGRFKVGQNIAYLETTGDAHDLSLMDMVDMWYNEVSDFDSGVIDSYVHESGPETAHYTQLVWAKTTKFGCGVRLYYTGSMNRKYLVCDYGPTGNMKTEPVYETD